MLTATVLCLSLCVAEVNPIGPELPLEEIVRGWPSWSRIVDGLWYARENYAHTGSDEAWHSFQVWKQVHHVTDKGIPAAERRDRLQNLIHLTSWRVVLTGEFPPPIPWEKQR